MKKIILLVTVAILVAYLAFTRTTGVKFTLKNVGTEALHAVTVEVTGKSYALGDILPGASKRVKVNPVGESNIKLRFSNGRMLAIDCYMEHDYGGSIEASVTPQVVVAVKDEITLPSLF